MQEKQIINIRHGVWIDEQWLRKAGLGARLQIETRNGEIRIQGASESVEQVKPSEKGWDTLRSLGNDAVVGSLKNAAEDHDRYLYGKQS